MGDPRQAALEDALGLQPSLEAIALLGPEGEILAMAADRALEPDIAPLLTLLTTAAERAGRELGRGGLCTAVIEGTLGHVVLTAVEGGCVLGLVAGRTAAPGLLLDDARALAERVRMAEA